MKGRIWPVTDRWFEPYFIVQDLYWIFQILKIKEVEIKVERDDLKYKWFSKGLSLQGRDWSYRGQGG